MPFPTVYCLCSKLADGRPHRFAPRIHSGAAARAPRRLHAGAAGGAHPLSATGLFRPRGLPPRRPIERECLSPASPPRRGELPSGLARRAFRAAPAAGAVNFRPEPAGNAWHLSESSGSSTSGWPARESAPALLAGSLRTHGARRAETIARPAVVNFRPGAGRKRMGCVTVVMIVNFRRPSTSAAARAHSAAWASASSSFSLCCLAHMSA